MKSLRNKRTLITGASSGLGLELTKRFIKSGSEVIMLCRNEEKSKIIKKELTEDYPNAVIHLEIVDFSNLSNLNIFIDNFKKRYSSLDILINNAAVLKSNLTMTSNDFETMFQVNYLAPFIFTNSLIDLLKMGNDPLIINIALPPKKENLNFNDLQSLNRFKPMNNLLNNKLCLFMYSLELANRLNDSEIKVITGIPNNRPFKSNLGREMPFLMGLAMKMISVKTENIAGNILEVISSDILKNGLVFKGKDEFSLTSYWQDKDIRNKLWNFTEQLVANV